MKQPADFSESHTQRMVRKFGSQEEFDRVKNAHGLIPRGAEVGLDGSVGFTQAVLDKRIQSCTLNSHRLVLYIANRFGSEASEALYSQLNQRHFIQGGVLNDRTLLTDSLEQLSLSDADLRDAVAFLDDEQVPGRDEVLALYDRVQSLGIYSIPTLVVDGQVTSSGASRAPDILNILEAAVQRGIKGTRLFGDITVA